MLTIMYVYIVPFSSWICKFESIKHSIYPLQFLQLREISPVTLRHCLDALPLANQSLILVALKLLTLPLGCHLYPRLPLLLRHPPGKHIMRRLEPHHIRALEKRREIKKEKPTTSITSFCTKGKQNLVPKSCPACAVLERANFYLFAAEQIPPTSIRFQRSDERTPTLIPGESIADLMCCLFSSNQLKYANNLEVYNQYLAFDSAVVLFSLRNS